MTDMLWMLSSLFGGGFVALFAVDATGRPAIAIVVAIASGWAMAQRDENYQRVKSEKAEQAVRVGRPWMGEMK